MIRTAVPNPIPPALLSRPDPLPADPEPVDLILRALGEELALEQEWETARDDWAELDDDAATRAD
jgi:hypothetical protein